MNKIQKQILRLLVNMKYEFQEIRISSNNRIRDIIYKLNEGIDFDEVENKKEKKEFTKKYTDAQLNEILNQLSLEERISKEELEYYEKCKQLIKGPSFNKMFECKHCGKKNKLTIETGGAKDLENEADKLLTQIVRQEPIWTIFLDKIKGIGEILAANIIKEFGDCSQYDTVSKLWCHTGNHTIDGIAPKRRKGQTIRYNPKLRTLTYLISESLMKQNKGYYRKIYNEYKEKQLAREYPEGELAEKFNGYKKEDTHLSKGHAHMRALRKIRKLFLSHYWEAVREFQGLPTDRTYIEGVLNHTHIVHWKEVIEMEDCLKE